MLSAVFAALTAVFAKLGVTGVDSDLATLIRTAIVLLLLAPLVWATGKWSDPFALPPRTLLFLALSALATAASWICYYRALQVGDAAQPLLEPGAKVVDGQIGHDRDSIECAGERTVYLPGRAGVGKLRRTLRAHLPRQPQA